MRDRRPFYASDSVLELGISPARNSGSGFTLIELLWSRACVLRKDMYSLADNGTVAVGCHEALILSSCINISVQHRFLRVAVNFDFCTSGGSVLCRQTDV
jgi:hypothetical protein